MLKFTTLNLKTHKSNIYIKKNSKKLKVNLKKINI